MDYKIFLKVLILRVLAPPSRLPLTIRLVLYYKGFLKVLNLRVLALPSRLTLIIRACFVLQGIFKSSEFAFVGSAIEVGLDYRGLPYITRVFF